jgi:hypothetical protein
MIGAFYDLSSSGLWYRMMNMILSRRFLWAAALTLIVAFPLAAAESSGGSRSRGDYLTLKVAVMGPGDELYFWWGHIALVIDDALTGESRFYDYGVFDFTADNFFVNFAFGRLFYYCAVSPNAELNYRAYRMTNRDITLYTLDVPPEKRLEVLRFAENNVRPENRYYFYHHFKDNCSTRIRDIVDIAVGGQFKAAFGEAPGRFTLRQNVRRHTWFNPLFDWFLGFLMGQDIDTPLTVWQELFLPSEMGNRIADFTYTGSDGRERKLVTDVEILNRAEGRPAPLDVPRRQWPRELVFGLFLAALAGGLIVVGRSRPVLSRVSLGIFQALLGLFFGAAGSLLVFMSFFTNHDYSWHNINVLFINPLLLAAVPLGIMLARGKGAAHCSAGRSSRRSARRSSAWLLSALWTYVFFGGLLSLVLRALPGLYQQNQVTLALILPVALTLSRIPHWIFARRPAREHIAR